MLPKNTKVAAKVNVIEEKVEIDDQLKMKGLLAKEHKDVASLVVENPSMAEDKQEAGIAIVSSKDAAKESERKVEEKVFEETSKEDVAASAAAEKPSTKKAEPKPKEKAKAAKLLDKEETMNKQDTKSANDNEETVDDDDEWEDLTPADTIFHFTIKLDEISPVIWRKFQVPSLCTFLDLHNTIQSCMGWGDCHLHEFRIKNPKTSKMQLIGSKCNEFGIRRLCGSKLNIADYFTEDNKKAKYVYDFGDYWVHTLTLDKIGLKKNNTVYPRCLSGKFACPPEDVGGISGYYNFLKIMKNPKHPEHKEMKEWHNDVAGSDSYDPNDFDPKKVMFMDICCIM